MKDVVRKLDIILIPVAVYRLIDLGPSEEGELYHHSCYAMLCARETYRGLEQERRVQGTLTQE